MSISKTIINKVSKALLDNRQEMEDFSLVPNVFDIYIHTEDYNSIRSFITTLRGQIENRLNRELQKYDKSRRQGVNKILSFFEKLFGFGIAVGRKELRRNEENWDISFNPTDGSIQLENNIIVVKKGEVCIVASISSPDSHNLDTNFGTLVTLYKLDGSIEKSVVATRQGETLNNSSETNIDLNDRTRPEEAGPKPNALATLKYKYKGEKEFKVFSMEKEKIVIGRQTHADLVLFNASDKISRKHLEIRFDKGKFFLKSFGIYGTSLNEKNVLPRG